MNYRLYVLLFVLMIMSCGNDANQQLFDKYYTPFEIQLNPNAQVRHAELDTAFQAYQKGDFVEVERITTAFLRDYYSVPQVMFAQSIAFLELNRDDEAVDNFITLSMHPNFGPQANWYAALVELRRGNNDAAITYLEKVIMRIDVSETIDAENLIKEIEKLD